MGISFDMVEKLRCRGMLASGTKVLDIGSSNLYRASFQQVRDFILAYRPADSGSELDAFSERIARGTGYDPEKGGANETFVGELLEYCGLKYLAFDIADGYKTRIFDLNKERLGQEHRGAFDLVLNLGTTEHVLNQYNSFEVIHDAARVGGHIVHQLPTTGFTDHAYFTYTGRLLFDLAGYNSYEVVDVWYDGPTGSDDLLTSVRNYQTYFPALEKLAKGPPIPIPNYGLSVILRKTRDAPFLACLETSTSVGNIPSEVHRAYKAGGAVAKAVAQAAIKSGHGLTNVLDYLKGIGERWSARGATRLQK